MKSKKVTAVTLVMGMTAVLAASSNLRAEMKAGDNRIAIRSAAAIPTGVNDVNQTSGVGAINGLQYLHAVDEHIQVGAQADYLFLPAKDHTTTSSLGGALTEDTKASSVLVQAVGRYSFVPDHKWVPFASVGIGIARYHQTSDATPPVGSGWADTYTRETRQVASDTSVSFAASFGGGVETMLTDRISLGLEANWNVIGASKSKFGSSVVNIPTVGLNGGWKF